MEEGRVGCDDDVVFSILLWLPVVSLLRFKSVCKSWRSLIESPGFIDQHTSIHQNVADDERLLVVLHTYNVYEQRPLQACYLYTGKFFQSMTTFKLKSIGFPKSLRRFENFAIIIATCNGIICLESDSAKIYLWNPTTKQYKSLPSPSLDRDSGDSDSKRNLNRLDSSFISGGFRSGFGFDATTRDYKVVVMVIHRGENLVKSGVEIYSLRTNSWRIIDSVLPVKLKFIYSNPKSLSSSNREIYWLGRYDVGEAYHFLILSFDFATEMFDTMSVPDVYSHVPYANFHPLLKLVILSGKIALIERIPDIEDNCKVWVLQEYGVKESWTNLYSLRLDSLGLLYGVSNTGKIIWGQKDYVTLDSRLCLCDPATQETMVIPCPCKEVIETDLQVATYKESLVSIRSATDTSEGVGEKTFGESSSEESSSGDEL